MRARRVCGGLSFGGALAGGCHRGQCGLGVQWPPPSRPRAVTSVGRRVPLCKGKTSGRAPRPPPPTTSLRKPTRVQTGCVRGGRLRWETPLSREPPADRSPQSSHAKGVKAWGPARVPEAPGAPLPLSPASSALDCGRPAPSPACLAGQGCRWEAGVPGCSRGWCNFLIREVTVLCLPEPGIQWKVWRHLGAFPSR